LHIHIDSSKALRANDYMCALHFNNAANGCKCFTLDFMVMHTASNEGTPSGNES